MLDLLAKNKRGFWANESNIFFEPTCGHGNIVLAIFNRRLEAIYKKNIAQYGNEAAFYAVSNSLNTIWAIDIDHKNIKQCQERVFSYILKFFKNKFLYNSEIVFINENRDFFAHILSAIKWQIFESETLSGLSDEEYAEQAADLTKSGAKWYKKNGHCKVDFNLSWVDYYNDCTAKGLVPIEYERSLSFIKNILRGRNRGFLDFSFAKFLFNSKKSSEESKRFQIQEIGA